MTALSTCPAPEELLNYAQGTISEPRAQFVEEHLSVCQPCEQVFTALDLPHDALVAALRASTLRRGEEAVADGASLAAGARPDVLATGSGAPLSAGGRFRILRPHAEGGLGKVSVARDEELGRDVALKEIQERHADNPQSRNRFLVEAEITGGLEHPGIVPVYGLGQFADGRPFYAMRFIRGDSLQEAIKRYYANETDRGTGPSAEENLKQRARLSAPASLEFRKLLRRFLDVCNAIAYAHSRGVLHRDLKPGNIMLGQYGETLVVDWGLAKATNWVELAAKSPEGPLKPASGNGSSETEMGTTVGTPAYMSPEQAAGRLDLLGPPSDVYSLGATLYQLLTGRPPIEQSGAADALRRVRQGDFPRPREIDAHIPRPLEAICLKAMSLKPEDRYATPRQLAEEIDRWLADEAVLAYPDPLFAKLSRAARRHRVATAAVSALLVTAVVGLSIGTALLSREQLQTEKARKEANANLITARAAWHDAETAASREKAAAEREKRAAQLAQQNYKLALGTLEKVIFDIQRKLADVPAAHEVRRGLLATAMSGLQALAEDDTNQDAGRDRDSMVALWEIGDLLLRVGDEGGLHGTQKATEAYRQAFRIAQRLSDADPKNAQDARALSVSLLNLGNVTLQRGDAAGARKYFEQASEIARRLATFNPEDVHTALTLWLSIRRQGEVSLQMGDAAAARKHFEQALEISRRMSAVDPKDAQVAGCLYISHGLLGDVTLKMGDADGARKYYEQALEIGRRLAANEPTNAGAIRDLAISYDNLGNATLQLGDAAGARKYYEQALEIRRRRAEADQKDAQAARDLLVSHTRLGTVALQMGDAVVARKYYEQGLEISRRLSESDPSNSEAARDLALSYSKLGNVTLQMGDAARARKYYEQCLEIASRRVPADRNDGEATRVLSISYEKLGDVMLQIGDAVGARKNYEQALEINCRRAAVDPKNSWVARGVSVSFEKLGAVTLQMGDAAGARKYYEQALEIRYRRAKADQKDAQAARDLAVSYGNLGDATLQLGDAAGARKYNEQALEIFGRRTTADPTDAQAAHDLLVSYCQFGALESRQSNYVDALQWLDRARRHAEAMIQRGQIAEASAELTELRKSIADCEAKVKNSKGDLPSEKVKPPFAPERK